MSFLLPEAGLLFWMLIAFGIVFLVLYRYGKYVREHIYPEGDRFHGAMFHTSGIVCKFVTDSKSLGFSWISTPAGGDHSFDVCADGVMYARAVYETQTDIAVTRDALYQQGG